MPNIKLYLIYLPRFFSLCPILGGKWTFLSYQVIAVLFVHVKIKNGVLCGDREMAETTEGICWKGVWVYRARQASTKSPKSSFGVP